MQCDVIAICQNGSKNGRNFRRVVQDDSDTLDASASKVPSDLPSSNRFIA